MITVDINKRFSVRQCLEHEWFSKVSSKSMVEGAAFGNPEVLENLKKLSLIHI